MTSFPQCHFCTKRFQNVSILEIHIRSHTKEKPFKCDEFSCLKGFSQPHLVRIHNEIVHGTNPIFDPELNPTFQCDKKFESSSKLAIHLQTFQHVKKVHKCSHCDKLFSTITVRNLHVRHVHEKRDKTHFCGIDGCLAKFISKSYLTVHRNRLHSEKRFTCQVTNCGREFKTRWELTKHDQIRHQPRKFVECGMCKKSMVKNSLTMHMRMVHGDESKIRRLECGLCYKKFKNNHNLQAHIDTHTKEKMVACNLCGKQLSSESGLKLHLASELHLDGEKPFPCPHCEKAYRQRTTLVTHIKDRHTGEGTVHRRCPECAKVFSTRSIMLKHLRNLHIRGKEGHCYFCAKQMKKESMRKHLLLHTKECGHKCDICRISFTSEGDLRNHVSIHTGEAMYKCKVTSCPSRFGSYYYLQQHLIEAHAIGAKTRRREARGSRNCPVCKIQLFSDITVTHHLKKTHPTELQRLYELETTCYFCKAHFSSKLCLEIHLRRHMDEKPYKCETCKKFLADARCTTKICIKDMTQGKKKVGLFSAQHDLYDRTEVRKRK